MSHQEERFHDFQETEEEEEEEEEHRYCSSDDEETTTNLNRLAMLRLTPTITTASPPPRRFLKRRPPPSSSPEQQQQQQQPNSKKISPLPSNDTPRLPGFTTIPLPIVSPVTSPPSSANSIPVTTPLRRTISDVVTSPGIEQNTQQSPSTCKSTSNNSLPPLPPSLRRALSDPTSFLENPTPPPPKIPATRSPNAKRLKRMMEMTKLWDHAFLEQAEEFDDTPNKDGSYSETQSPCSAANRRPLQPFLYRVLSDPTAFAENHPTQQQHLLAARTLSSSPNSTEKRFILASADESPSAKCDLSPLPPRFRHALSDLTAFTENYPTPSPPQQQQLLGARTSSRSPNPTDKRSITATAQDSPTARRLKRMRARMREMRKWCDQLIPEEAEGHHGLLQHNTPKDGSETETAWVESVGSCLTIHFKCPCGKIYEILLSGDNVYYMLTRFRQDELENQAEEKISVERNENCIIINTKCPCSKGYFILLAGKSCFYRLL